MPWKIGECEFDPIARTIRPTIRPRLGEPDAALLEALIKRYGTKYRNEQLIRDVWGEGGSVKSLYKSVEHLREAFGPQRRAFILARPVRLAKEPKQFSDDELTYGRGIIVSQREVSIPGQSAKSSSSKNDNLTLVVDGIIINSVSELIHDDPETAGIRRTCSASYERSLADLAFATVYAERLVTSKDFRPSLTTPDQPGQELAARLGEICEQRAYPSKITDGHLFRDEDTRNGIRDDIQRFSQCLADTRTARFFRDYMLREATKHFGSDLKLFQDDIHPDDYKFDVKRPFYMNRKLQDGLGSATDLLVSFLPKTPPNSTDLFATNALREFATRNVLTHITIMWEGEEYARETGARRAPHVLRSLVTLKRFKDRVGTQHQEIVRDLVIEHALTTALRNTQRKNRQNLVGVLLNLRDDYPFKQIRELLNDRHLVLMEPDPKKEQEARKVLRQLKALTASTSMLPDRVHLANDSAIRAFGGARSGEYEHELYRVFPELAPVLDRGRD